jgi:DNA-directed RNA polymerase subunit RPC12/RpoP
MKVYTNYRCDSCKEISDSEKWYNALKDYYGEDAIIQELSGMDPGDTVICPECGFEDDFSELKTIERN